MMGLRHVLYVEDEPTQARWLSDLSGQEGFDVRVASTARQAVKLLVEYPMDVALVDLGLPDRSGIDLIRQIRELGSDVPVVVLTGSHSHQDAVEAMKAGASDYLTKPCTGVQLKGALEEVLRTSQRQRETARLLAQAAETLSKPRGAGRERSLQDLLRRAAPGIQDESPLDHGGLHDTVARIERAAIREALDRNGWVKARAARALGVTERILSYKMQILGIRRIEGWPRSPPGAL